jgi:hypothetical protein
VLLRSVPDSFPSRLSATHHPRAVAFDLPELIEGIAEVETELSARAALDKNRCCGYFPALIGVRGIDGNLPACRAFAERLPAIGDCGTAYRFNFIRLSLAQQSVDPAFHLDSDAATALSGDVSTIKQRRVSRLLLNLNSQSGRALHFLDVDPNCVDLVSDGSYVRAADPRKLMKRAMRAVIPPRSGSRLSGLLFPANLVLHSGVDDAGGHFVAAYGIDAMEIAASAGRPAWNAARKPSRRSRWAEG